jgi:hypothetical protein
MRSQRAKGIRDKPIAPSSPWQNGFAEGLIGSEFLGLGRALCRSNTQAAVKTNSAVLANREIAGRFGDQDTLHVECGLLAGT